ncbi:RagB/SusD family nutrient uptake outer membrane protein [Sphingobacterium sp. WOUb80]|uniref:RagB/SusD family nutrient uptake outer membrane protein n=1 Tax=Sphingobacterium sp. WOUb80 TaxID=3234028 RepID=UPI003CE96C5E
MRSFKYILKRIIMGAVPFSLLFTSCNKQLDELRPHNVIFEDMQFASPTGYSEAVTGIYALVSGAAAIDKGTNYNDMLIFLSEAKGNTIKSLDGTINKQSDAFDFINTGTRDFSHSYNFWRSGYNVILHANEVIAHVKDGETNGTILQAKAEALFLRAFTYFNLVRLYGRPYYLDADKSPGVMLVLDTRMGPDYAPARASVAEVYQQVISDLETAAGLFNQSKSNSYASKYSAYALLSRVYLYMGGTSTTPVAAYNQKAADYAAKVINEGGYQLLQNTAYQNYYKTDNPGNKEDIFAVNTKLRQGGISIIFANPLQGTRPGGLYRPSPYLKSLLDANDLRNSFYVENVTAGFPDDTKAVSKYMLGFTTLYSVSPFRYLRLAEMYLNRAEALYKLKKESEALADVNTIRKRAGLSELSGLSGTTLFNEILKQRKLELAFEGHASFDEFRNGLPMVRNYDSGKSGAMTVQPTDKKILMPIPEEERAENPNLVPN